MHRVTSRGWVIGIYLASRGVALFIAALKTPPLVETLYLPFIEGFLRSPSLDPWSNNNATLQVTNPDAFPYGWPLLLGMALFVHVFDIVGNGSVGILALYAIADAIVFLALFRLSTSQRQFPALLYALSPPPIIALALVGSNDFVPMVAITLGVLAVIARRPILAGVAFGLAVGTKAILVLALIAAILFLYREHRDRVGVIKMGVTALVVTIMALSPATYSVGFREALTTSQSAIATLSFGLSLQQQSLLIVPWILALSVYGVLRLKRMNVDLLMLAIATPLYLMSVLPSGPTGWYLWASPLLAVLLSKLPVRFFLLATTGALLAAIGARTLPIFDQAPSSLQPLLYGSSLSLGLLANIVLVALLWRQFFARSDFVKLREKPALILISGDSGTGKDTLAEGFTRCLGQDSTVHLSGDDYHLWDRHNRAWKFFTHLNPEANDLSGYFRAIIDLVSGKSISVGKYDHRLGRRLSPRTAQSREFVISSGLHALWSPDINAMSSLSIFLEMEDRLRLQLKLARDVAARGHNPQDVLGSIESRKEDYATYVLQQKDRADLVVRSSFVAGSVAEVGPVLTEFRSQPKIFDSRLVSELIHTCGLEAEYRYGERGERLIIVAGDFEPSLANIALERMEPEVFDILLPSDGWSKGAPGIVQFVSVIYLVDSLRRERLIR